MKGYKPELYPFFVQYIYRLFKRVASLAKSVSPQHHFQQFIGNQRRIERQGLVFLKLNIDCVTQFFLQRQCRAQFRL